MLRERSSGFDLAPAAVTWRYDFAQGMGGRTPTEDPGKPVGILEALICKACGFTDLYTQRPETIPIGSEYGTEEIEVPESPPYR